MVRAQNREPLLDTGSACISRLVFWLQVSWRRRFGVTTLMPSVVLVQCFAETWHIQQTDFCTQYSPRWELAMWKNNSTTRSKKKELRDGIFSKKDYTGEHNLFYESTTEKNGDTWAERWVWCIAVNHFFPVSLGLYVLLKIIRMNTNETILANELVL